ncbi:hypothetical protein [Methylobacterium pseudosasicola]|uniref:hypothetical protein n=1 Tax=Methylobacterium pseudosasicola TaxID=582667 RepID=UPI0011139253|nr:hypothetical protein [Methylobacterium pseudosasicola]
MGAQIDYVLVDQQQAGLYHVGVAPHDQLDLTDKDVLVGRNEYVVGLERENVEAESVLPKEIVGLHCDVREQCLVGDAVSDNDRGGVPVSWLAETR